MALDDVPASIRMARGRQAPPNTTRERSPRRGPEPTRAPKTPERHNISTPRAATARGKQAALDDLPASLKQYFEQMRTQTRPIGYDSIVDHRPRALEYGSVAAEAPPAQRQKTDAEALALEAAFNEATGEAQVMLVGRARTKEIDWRTLPPDKLKAAKQAVVEEWAKWQEHSAIKPLEQSQLDEIMKRNPGQKIVGARWAIVE